MCQRSIGWGAFSKSSPSIWVATRVPHFAGRAAVISPCRPALPAGCEDGADRNWLVSSRLVSSRLVPSRLVSSRSDDDDRWGEVLRPRQLLRWNVGTHDPRRKMGFESGRLQ